MSQTSELAAAAADADPRVGFRAVLALRRLADRLEQIQVRNARRQGWSWQEIAQALGVTRQAVHQKHAGHVSAEPKGDD
jgi:DNA invertase Pin-like site-specific DNA recombinase